MSFLALGAGDDDRDADNNRAASPILIGKKRICTPHDLQRTAKYQLPGIISIIPTPFKVSSERKPNPTAWVPSSLIDCLGRIISEFALQ